MFFLLVCGRPFRAFYPNDEQRGEKSTSLAP